MFREIRTSERLTEQDAARNAAIQQLNMDIRRLLDKRIGPETKKEWEEIERRKRELGLI